MDNALVAGVRLFSMACTSSRLGQRARTLFAALVLVVVGAGCSDPSGPNAEEPDVPEVALHAVALAADALARGDMESLCRVVTPATRNRWYGRPDCSLAASTSTTASAPADATTFNDALIRSLRNAQVVGRHDGIVELEGTWGPAAEQRQVFYYYTQEPNSGLQLIF